MSGIHWVIERLHQDGTWEAVAFSSRIFDAFLGTTQDPYREENWPAAVHFLMPNEPWFELLSDLHGNLPEGSSPVALPGLPADASEFARLNFSGLEHLGHASLGRLRWAATPEGLAALRPGLIDAYILEVLVSVFESMLEGPEAIDLTEIHLGDMIGPDGSEYPEMTQASHHQRLARSARAKELLPVADDTLRLLVGYD